MNATHEIICGDAETVLRALPADSVQCCITSPPYFGLRDYGTEGQIGLEVRPDCLGWATGTACGECYVCRLVRVFTEVRRVLRGDGTLWLNLGDSYANSGGSSRDSERWPKQQRNGHTPVNAKRRTGLKPKDLIGIPWSVAFALRSAGWYLRSDIIWCLSGGAKVYARTQKGDYPMMIKDMVRLDPKTVKLWNGEKWTQVLGWSETPRPDKSFEIELRSGERIGCTANHEWPTHLLLAT